MSEEKILIVEDDNNIRELISFNLKSFGYTTLEAQNGITALEIIKSEYPDLLLLDLMLPGMDGLEVCRKVRGDRDIQDIPIIMLTARGEEFDRILGFELGADDYIAKPFSVRELLARVKAILRRTTAKPTHNDIEFDDITIDFDKYTVLKGGEKVEFTLKEFELLELLVKSKGKVLTREFLLDKVWGYEYLSETRTVDVHIRHIRQKIEKDDKNPRHIETIRGVGYKFNLQG